MIIQRRLVGVWFVVIAQVKPFVEEQVPSSQIDLHFGGG
jgi:hypothetical protein